jgi:hypothetical protein
MVTPVGLDYGGIDYGIDRDGGNLPLFEANATNSDSAAGRGGEVGLPAARDGAVLPRRSCDADGPCGVR